ncbi:phospholipase/Carboxylesterase superfamily protein [Apodospora peruviana]|uniref:Phospholipase/Carboxylesterase superfamily protein n=1 Tax=Apodospora peruviana TaxID=516989 RepID=A0AAE0MCZ7_9PEZI|nr:phospholipase/Carboxylesterase superfamily protein [Apodospora peruviana]
MASIRIPTESDFDSLTPQLTTSLVFPSPRESTTVILILFHGLGDSESSFASFARSLNLPGVLAISVRGTAPLPPVLVGDLDSSGPGGPRHFHWGDDLRLSDGGDLDTDPGFEKAQHLILDRLVGEVLIGNCGWEVADILLFGFGQGGSFALGLASRVRDGLKVSELEEGNGDERRGKAFKGVISIGGPLPNSMVPTVSSREKSRTPVLICHGRESESIDEDVVDVIKKEFTDVQVVEWKKKNDGMPESREEVLPMMRFFAECLRS